MHPFHPEIKCVVKEQIVESRKGAVAWAIWQRPVSLPTGSPEAVTRLRFPQNVACGFPAPTLFGSWFTALPAPAAPGRGDAVWGSATVSVL